MNNSFKAIIEEVQKGEYFSHCLEIPTANGQDEAIEECCQDLAQAIELVLEDLGEEQIHQISLNV